MRSSYLLSLFDFDFDFFGFPSFCGQKKKTTGEKSLTAVVVAACCCVVVLLYRCARVCALI